MRVRCAHMGGHTHKGDPLTRLYNSRFPLRAPPPARTHVWGPRGLRGCRPRCTAAPAAALATATSRAGSACPAAQRAGPWRRMRGRERRAGKCRGATRRARCSEAWVGEARCGACASCASRVPAVARDQGAPAAWHGTARPPPSWRRAHAARQTLDTCCAWHRGKLICTCRSKSTPDPWGVHRKHTSISQGSFRCRSASNISTTLGSSHAGRGEGGRWRPSGRAAGWEGVLVWSAQCRERLHRQPWLLLVPVPDRAQGWHACTARCTAAAPAGRRIGGGALCERPPAGAAAAATHMPLRCGGLPASYWPQHGALIGNPPQHVRCAAVACTARAGAAAPRAAAPRPPTLVRGDAPPLRDRPL